MRVVCSSGVIHFHSVEALGRLAVLGVVLIAEGLLMVPEVGFGLQPEQSEWYFVAILCNR